MLTKNADKKDFVSILSSDATLRMVVPEGTKDSVVREYETSDGKTGKKTELVWNKISGKISDIAFYDGDFGKLIQLDITDSAGTLTLSVNTATNYGEDIMKKLPAVDMEKEVEFAPYTFENDKGKTVRGVTITQDGKKIKNFFRDETGEKNINGYPDPVGDTKSFDKDDWKMYYMTARKFLIAYITEKFPTKSRPQVVSTNDIADIYPTEDSSNAGNGAF